MADQRERRRHTPTPGPWMESTKMSGHVFSGDRLICSAMGHYDGKDDTRDENIANARLIAAAPALKEALQKLLEKLDAVHSDPQYAAVWQIAQLHRGSYTGPKYDIELAAARAALRLAEGQE